jgi:hypothetical protein
MRNNRDLSGVQRELKIFIVAIPAGNFNGFQRGVVADGPFGLIPQRIVIAFP